MENKVSASSAQGNLSAEVNTIRDIISRGTQSLADTASAVAANDGLQYVYHDASMSARLDYIRTAISAWRDFVAAVCAAEARLAERSPTDSISVSVATDADMFAIAVKYLDNAIRRSPCK